MPYSVNDYAIRNTRYSQPAGSARHELLPHSLLERQAVIAAQDGRGGLVADELEAPRGDEQRPDVERRAVAVREVLLDRRQVAHHPAQLRRRVDLARTPEHLGARGVRHREV